MRKAQSGSRSRRRCNHTGPRPSLKIAGCHAAVWQRIVDVNVDELADQSRVVAAEVDDAIVLGTALQHAGVLFE